MSNNAAARAGAEPERNAAHAVRGVPRLEVALAFDRLAPAYDALWTRSAVGRAQRKVVWRRAMRVFKPGDHLLELNCGTGEDALFLARAGFTITACDASIGMINQARKRHAAEDPDCAIGLVHLASEELAQLAQPQFVDGVFSNFSGLNCVGDLPALARVLRRRVVHGAPLLLCVSTRFCLWEIAFHSLQGQWRKGFRRCGGRSEASLDGLRFPVYYPTLAHWRRAFSPGFRLRAVTGVGITVPPSYVEGWSIRHPRALAALVQLDRVLCALPVLRCSGDHMLLHLEAI